MEVDLSLRAGGDRVASGSAGFAVVPAVWSWDGHRREKCRLVCASQHRATQRAGRLQSFIFRLFAIITVVIVNVVITAFNAVVEDAHPFCVYSGRMWQELQIRSHDNVRVAAAVRRVAASMHTLTPCSTSNVVHMCGGGSLLQHAFHA